MESSRRYLSINSPWTYLPFWTMFLYFILTCCHVRFSPLRLLRFKRKKCYFRSLEVSVLCILEQDIYWWFIYQLSSWHFNFVLTHSIDLQFLATLSPWFCWLLPYYLFSLCLTSSYVSSRNVRSEVKNIAALSFTVDFAIVTPCDLCSTSWAVYEGHARAISLNTWACLELVWLRGRGSAFMEPL